MGEWFVDCGIYFTIFEDYHEAEVFCREHGISVKNIYEGDPEK
jgi:hypothetical protein